MDMESQQYCLRWNNHRSNLLTVFEQLLQTEAFTDVTLAVNGTSIKCHKMVLAACSSYFQSLFLENACPHPIVVFKDIQYAEIRAILEYMYRGEVNVAQEQLPSLLKVAEALRVKGLFEDDSVSGTHTHTHTHTLSLRVSIYQMIIIIIIIIIIAKRCWILLEKKIKENLGSLSSFFLELEKRTLDVKQKIDSCATEME